MKSIIVRSGITSVSLERFLKTIIQVRITSFIHLCWDKCILPLLLASSANYTVIKCPGLMRFQNTHIHFGPFLGSAMSCSSSLQASLFVWLCRWRPQLRVSCHKVLWVMPSMNKFEKQVQSRVSLLWGDWVGFTTVFPTGRSPYPSSYPFISLPALASITHSTDPPWKQVYFPCLVLLSSTDLRRVQQISCPGEKMEQVWVSSWYGKDKQRCKEPGNCEAPRQLEPACSRALYNNELSDKITNSEKTAPWADTPFSIWWESV